jgi:hypothetical protein
MSSTSLFADTRFLQSQDLAVLLGRSYKIDEFTWIGPLVDGASFISYEVPNVLVDTPFLATIIHRYAYFRAKAVHISFRVQSTTMHYGVLCISHTYDGNPNMAEPAARFNNRPMLLSAMPASVVELDIPYVHHKPWLRVARLSDDDAHAMATIFIDIMTPLKSVGTDDTGVTVSVYANFVEPEVLGPSLRDPPALSLLPLETRRNDPFSHVTKRRQDKENAKKEKDVPKVVKIKDPVVAPYSGRVYNEHASGMAIPDFEGMAKSAKGIMSDVKEENYIGAAVQAIPLAISVGTSIAKLVADKPMSDSGATLVGFETGKDFVSGTGLQLGASMSLVPLARLSDRDASGTGGSHDILDLCRIPGYLDQHEILSTHTFAFWSKMVGPNVANYDSNLSSKIFNTFLSYFSAPFRYWSGGITYHFFFFTSKFVSARVRIAWGADHQTSIPLTGRTGDVISRVVDITGDTQVSVTIPFTADQPAKQVKKVDVGLNYQYAEAFHNGTIQAELVGPIASQVPDPTIQMVVYVSGANDFTLGYYDSVISHEETFRIVTPDTAFLKQAVIPQGGPPAKWIPPRTVRDFPSDALRRVQNEHGDVWALGGTGEPLQDVAGRINMDYIVSEHVFDLVTLAKRFQDTGMPGTNFPIYAFLYPDWRFQGGAHSTLTWAALPFTYWSGAVMHKTIRPKADVGEVINVYESNSADNNLHMGPQIISSPANNQNEINVNVPYFENTPYVPGLCRYNAESSRAMWFITDGPPLNWEHYQSAGDDFQLFHLFCPPQFEIL